MNYQKLFDFEAALAEYTGAPYVVVTDGCTHAMELCFRYELEYSCELPAFTYISVLQMLKQLGVGYTLRTEYWTGEYNFKGTRIWDSARRLERNMYRPGQLQCLSFGFDKPLPLGKGGAILLDNVADYNYLSQMRSDGRDLRINPWQDQVNFKEGYHYCPTLELCAEGLAKLPTIEPQSQKVQYPDLRLITIG
jgi:dTDP-4-amino-4,6-dideoxygalactose transaminase